MSIAQRVFDLFLFEQSIQDKRAQLEDMNLRIRHNEAHENAVQAQAEAERKRAEIEKQHKELDWEAEELRKKIEQINDKLYGGKVKNPKELQGLEQESVSLKASLSKKDDTLLELMEKIESGRGELKATRRNVSETEKNWNEEKESLGKQLQLIKDELENLEQKSQAVRNSVDKSVLSLYADLRSRKNHAVVKVEQGRCMGCRVMLSGSELQRVRGNSIVTCSNCGRILYLS